MKDDRLSLSENNCQCHYCRVLDNEKYPRIRRWQPWREDVFGLDELANVTTLKRQ